MHYYLLFHCCRPKSEYTELEEHESEFQLPVPAWSCMCELSGFSLHSLQLKLSLTTSPSLTSSFSTWRYMTLYECVFNVLSLCRFFSMGVWVCVGWGIIALLPALLVHRWECRSYRLIFVFFSLIASWFSHCKSLPGNGISDTYVCIEMVCCVGGLWD